MNILQFVDGVILAAGKGTRMKAHTVNKVMYMVGKHPIIWYPMQSLTKIIANKPIVVVGYAQESIVNFLKDSAQYAVQKSILGTADAVRAAVPFFDKNSKNIIILYADHSTFYTPDILLELHKKHIEEQAEMTLITTSVENPIGYGRILRDRHGQMTGIVEEKNATQEQKEIQEINTGNAIYSRAFLEKYLPKITKNSLSLEYYFTDIVKFGFEHGEKIRTYVVKDRAVGLGINTPDQLEEVNAELRLRG